MLWESLQLQFVRREQHLSTTLRTFLVHAVITMSQQLKTAFIGTLGLATLIICIYAFSRKSKSSGGASEGKSATSSLKKDDVDLSSGGSSSEAPVESGERGLDVGGDVARGGVEAKEGDQELGDGETLDSLVARFNKANSLAKKYFKAHKYELAAEHYGVALSLCNKLPNHGDKRTALHNNRGAALEKAGKYESSLEECTMCLSRDPTHPLARVRKSRVLEAMGKPVEALAEVCAHVLLERDRFETRAMLNPVATFSPPNPPPNLEGLLSKIAKSRAEDHLAKKEQEAAKEAKEAGGKPKPKPLGKNVVTELLRSFGSFSEIERRFKGVKETALTRKLESAEVQDGGDGKSVPPVLEHASADRVPTLLDRAMVRLVKKKYEEAREDIFEAVEVLTQLQKTAGNEGIGVPGDVQAAVWEWKGTFLQLVTELDGAMEAYENACLVLEEEGKPATADLLIKMAYLFLDKDNRDEAKKYFKRAEEQFPNYGSVYAHMSRLGMSEGGNSPEVVEMLEKAVELNKTDVYSWESLAKVYVQNGDMNKAWATTIEALKFVPKAEALLLLKAELKFSMAVNTGDASAGPEIMEMFDEAIREHPLSATLYISKSAFLVQMVNDVSGAVEALETAIAVEPTSVGAWVQLANLKVLIAKTTQEVKDVTVLLQKAIDICTTDQDVVDTFSVLVATEGRINGAALLGRSSFS